MISDYYQDKIIKYSKDLLVIAGPGAGKTTTIINKINYLLKNTNEDNILLISFTNQSVQDLKKKLNNNINIYTFHKLAIDILNTYKINYKICPSDLLNYIIDEYFINYKNKHYLFNKFNIKSINDKNYPNIKKLIITFINLYKTNGCNFNKLKKITNELKYYDLIIIILDIFKKYEEEKKASNLFDFDDLIIKATALLKNNYQYKFYKYIIIDEFQDTSIIRLNLILEIYQKSNSIITVVGDDFQSIFHFSGCDLNIFINFKQYFPKSNILYLKNTYRNSQELINITSKFINKNPYQITKNMISSLHIKKPIIYIYYLNRIKAFKKLITKLIDKNILILSRNNNDIYNYIDSSFTYNNNILTFKNKTFKYLTMHSSKGLEEDYVIILNMENSKFGMPNQITNHPILKYVSSNIDNYPFSEERRLFFVALTRCKYQVFLLIPFINPSIFIKEIKKIKY